MANLQVAILMGSDSDLPVVSEAAKVLEEFGVAYEMHVLSAHRTPEDAVGYIKKSEDEGVKVIIAAAGGAAHLAGVCAGHFAGPVIGIPIKSKSLEGADSLYSTVQMPPGIPVATVGINGAKNAGLLAVQILSVGSEELKSKMKNYKKNMKESILKKDKKLQELGYKKYLESTGK